MIMSSSSVTTLMAEFDFLVSFLQGLWLAKMPICSILVDHGRIISVTVQQLVTSTLSVRSTVTRPLTKTYSQSYVFLLSQFAHAHCADFATSTTK